MTSVVLWQVSGIKFQQTLDQLKLQLSLVTLGIPQLGMVIGYWFIVRETSIIPLTFRSGKAGDAIFWRLLSLQHLLPNSRFKVSPGTPATIGNIVVSVNFSHTAAQKKASNSWQSSKTKNRFWEAKSKSEGKESERSSYSYNSLCSLTSP